MNTLHCPIRVVQDDGVATLTFAFAGPPANALNLTQLEQVVVAAERAAAHPDVEIVILQSGSSAGFCPGITARTLSALQHPADRQTYTARGQKLLLRLAELPVLTLAVVAGACRGPGLELALACDYRVAIAGPDSWIGFGPNLLPAWGGSAWLRRPLPGVVTAREAVKLGVFHDAFCARRAAMEVQHWVNRLQRWPAKPRRRPSWFGLTDVEKRAAERVRFARVAPPRTMAPLPLAPLPATVGIWGLTAATADVAIEMTTRGRAAVVVPRGGEPRHLEAVLEAGLARGRWTPLEAEQARARLCITNDPQALGPADWIVAGEPRPPVFRPTPVHTISSWYSALGLVPQVPPADAPRRLAAA